MQNPIHALAQFVADLHAPNGSVAVDGFYKYDSPSELNHQLCLWLLACNACACIIACAFPL